MEWQEPSGKQNDVQISEIELLEAQKYIHGRPLPDPVMGKNFKLPNRGLPHCKPTLNTLLINVPIYCHLNLHPLADVGKPTDITLPKLKLQSAQEKNNIVKLN